MSLSRPYPWEASYPSGLRWDAPIATGTLPELLADSVRRFGERPAIRFRDRVLSYRDLASLVERAASWLLELGIGLGQAVALYLPNTPWHPVFFFGALRAGARVVHLSPLDPPRALAQRMADSGARVLVTTNLPPLLPHALALLEEGAAERVIVARDAAWGAASGAMDIPAAPGLLPVGPLPDVSPPASWPAVAPGDLALLQYTGGTTGQPRAAMLTHANLTAALSIYQAWGAGFGQQIQAGDRCICVLPLFHIYALTVVLLRGLANGAELLLHARFDPQAVLEDIALRRAAYFPGVPTMWIALANHPGLPQCDFSSLRAAGSGGAALPVEVRDRLHHLTGLSVGGGWGMTETAPAGTSIPPGYAGGPGAIGLPLPGIVMDVVALDDPRRLLPPGEVGEIRIKGPNVTAGYWHRPEETRAAFVDGYFLTGDIGRMDAQGFFSLVDRKKEMILSGGFNVYPRMIEEAIHEHPAVQEAAVIGVPDPYRGQAAKAFVQLRPGAEAFTLEALRAFLSERLGRHELPAHLEIREALPRTPVGKLAKRVLAEEERAARSAAGEGD